MRIFVAVITAVLATTLVSCGSETEDRESAESTGDAQTADRSVAVYRGDCPPDLTFPARRDNEPVDDIVGLRPGMSHDDIVGILHCRDGISQLDVGKTWSVKQTYGIETRQLVRATDGELCSGQEIFKSMGGSQPLCSGGGSLSQIKNANETVHVAFAGMQGNEKAGIIWRHNSFAKGEAPTVQSVQESLSAKYGEPHQMKTDRRGRTSVTWIYDLLGRPMSRASDGYFQCARSIRPEFSSGHSWSPACGLTITAMLVPDQKNDLLLSDMHVAVAHQQRFYEAGEAFEEALVAAHESAKKAAAADASSTKAGPDL